MRDARVPRLIVGVLSAGGYRHRRASVLATWGADALAHPDVDLVFLVGDPTLRHPRRAGHFLYLPCRDDYRHLPQKTRWFCSWAVESTGCRWLFKCDDDTYVRVERLLEAIDSGCWAQPVVGCADGDGRHFHGGAGYVLSRAAATAVSERLKARRGLEDWKVRDAIAAAGLWFQHDDRFSFDATRCPRPSNRQITCHDVDPLGMTRLHELFADGGV